MTDISLGFVYRKGNPYLNNMRAQVNMRKLFFVALPRQLGVTVEYYGSPDVLDLKHVADNHDRVAPIPFGQGGRGKPGIFPRDLDAQEISLGIIA